MDGLLSTENKDLNNIKGSTSKKDGKHNKKHKRKSRNRKKSDPLVTNISQLLSASLSLISPDANASKCSENRPVSATKSSKNTPLSTPNCNDLNKNVLIEKQDTNLKGNITESNGKNDTIMVKITSPSGIINGNSEDVIELLDETPVKSKNAFEFMMESQRKSIGQNSPGKVLEKSELTPTIENKQKLAARKLLMTQWAADKGNKKRKIEEDKERDVYIKSHLQKRAKRMKKMLSIDTSVTEEKPKRIKKLICDSDDSQDTFLHRSDEKASKTNKNDTIINLDKNINKTNHLHQKDLNNFLKISPNSNKKDEEDNIFEISDNGSSNGENLIKIKMFSPKVFKRKKKISRNEIKSEESEVRSNESVVRSKKSEVSSRKSEVNLHKIDKNQENNGNKEEHSHKCNRNHKIREKNTKRTKDNESNRKSRNILKSVEDYNETSNDSLIIVKDSEEIENGTLRRSKRSIKPRHDNDYIVTYVDSDLEDSGDEKKERASKNKKAVKLAPIFIQNKVKPKIDPEVLEARRNFLLSGIPDALKRTVEKQQSVEIVEPDFFPEISHIQQKIELKEGTNFWNLSKVDLKTINLKIALPTLETLKKGSINDFSDSEEVDSSVSPTETISNLKSILSELKNSNPDYPVCKSYRLLKKKSKYYKDDEKLEKITSKKHKRVRKSSTKSSENEENKRSDNSETSMLWTEKYKATCHEDFIGNCNNVLDIKKWLEAWLEIDENKKVSKRRYSSDSDFDSSSISSLYPRNTIVLYGPHGSGKTMAIYAVCNELGINVLELNASSKRTGKWLLQEMQEATQSHQVRKSENSTLNNFFKPKDSENSKSGDSKLSLLLIEDLDVVFEQDEGFLGALMQLMTSSKRPIVLIATDISNPNLQKIVSQSTMIQFSALSPKVISIYIQILCLLEGYLIQKDIISELIELHDGDVRNVLLKLQFWLAGNEENRKSTIGTIEDDESLKVVDKSVCVRQNCIRNLTNRNVNLKSIWWNLPQFTVLPPMRKSVNEVDKTGFHKEDLINLANCLENLSDIDRCYSKLNILNNCTGLSVKNSRFRLLDSIELGENYVNFENERDFTVDWTQNLISGHVRSHEKDEGVVFDMGLPNMKEKRWRQKQTRCKDKYMELVPLLYQIDKRSFSLDYFPTLRTMTHSEINRSANINKRKNRFLNYLSNMGLDCSDVISETACRIFNNDFSDNSVKNE